MSSSPPPTSSSRSPRLPLQPWALSLAGALTILVVCFLCYCCCRKRRRDVNYAPSGPKDDAFGNGVQLQPFTRNAFDPRPSPLPSVASWTPNSSTHTTTSRPSSSSYPYGYGGRHPQYQQNAPPPSDHVTTALPKPSRPPPAASRPPHSPVHTRTRPPPPNFMSSSGGSRSNYSGSENPLPPPSPGITLSFSKTTFSSEELARATDGFSDANRLEIIRCAHHKLLVSLVGYYITGFKGMLVFEFIPNSPIKLHLHGHLKIIHRDIKPANILLDFKFEAKVVDFGLAKLSSNANTHVSTRVMDTFGYIAPEYASSWKLTDKSDVFSFGVMLLELITGRRLVDSTHSFLEDSLVDWARPFLTRSLEDGKFDTLVDSRLQNDCNHNEMACMVVRAAACVPHSAQRRPQMSKIVRALEGDVSLSDLNYEGIRPGHSSTLCGFSSEYSEPTSEYKLYPSGSSSKGQSCQTTWKMEIGKMKKSSQGFSGRAMPHFPVKIQSPIFFIPMSRSCFA